MSAVLGRSGVWPAATRAFTPISGPIRGFRAFVKSPGARDQVALDVAFQVSPDHPYVQEHAEWFRKRPDGTIQYAENPPKKYQDIYPFDFESADWQPMWNELRDVFVFWIDEGVNIFRVDNPHTKAFPFWEWCIGDLKSAHPQVLFLSEAFTRPKVMYRLSKGRLQSVLHLLPVASYKAGDHGLLHGTHADACTRIFSPQSLAEYSGHSHRIPAETGRPGFMLRLLLAATRWAPIMASTDRPSS